MAEEWTFVSHKRSSKPSRRRRTGKANNTHHDDDGMKRFFDNRIITSQASQQQTEAEKLKDRERIRAAILESIRALENVMVSSDTSFSHRLIAALREVTSSSSASDGEEDADNTKAETKNDEGNDGNFDDASFNLNLREIVAYGIGNFATTSSFSAPMLQLACVLFLRRHATASSIIPHSSHTDTASNDNGVQDIFKREQDQVPIYYYEPCILPVERELLETVFHVVVLDNNEFGKLHLQSMRQPDGDNASKTATTISTSVPKSLFYMPHCPMRLYCNVLWSHWETLPSTIIYGNSFHSYDERTVSAQGQNDQTNGILRIIHCTNEISIKLRGNKRGDELYDALNHLETAFNDCNIISFTAASADCHRPDEYFASNDNENRELSR